MPALSNAKHERFAQGLAKGLPAIKAYEEAGYKPDRGAASRLSANVSIMSRVAELQERGAIRAEITAAKLIEYADDVRTKAMEAGQFASAVSAIKEMGVLAGVRIEKHESRNRGLSEMTDDELADHIRTGGAGAAEKAAGAAKPH